MGKVSGWSMIFVSADLFDIFKFRWWFKVRILSERSEFLKIKLEFLQLFLIVFQLSLMVSRCEEVIAVIHGMSAFRWILAFEGQVGTPSDFFDGVFNE